MGLLGNASRMSDGKVDKLLRQVTKVNLLVSGEKILHSYGLIRDVLVFTNLRVIFVNKEALTGVKAEYHSYPYNAISHFSIQTRGMANVNGVLRLWMDGDSNPTREVLCANNDVLYEISNTLAVHTLE